MILIFKVKIEEPLKKSVSNNKIKIDVSNDALCSLIKKMVIVAKL
ncbi:MAG: hypothetical protein PHE16_07595 [Aliarcobacter sp.]|nr:hypothetical protein [Aliarcobacter sp.]